MAHPVIHFDYDFSPYGQKTKLLLKAAGVDFQKCDQPAMLPRKDLEDLGITYRRIPLLAIGKDVYCDSAKIIETILSTLGQVPTSPSDLAFKEWGDTAFQDVLSLVPLQVLTPDFVKDRETVFPILKRPDIKSLRPSGLAGFQARLRQVEDVFLANSKGPFLNGEKLSMADIHIVWPLRWALKDLGASQDPGCGKAEFPKVWKMIESLPESTPNVMPAQAVQMLLLQSEYSASAPKGIQKDEPLGIAEGTAVTVESFDSTPGSHPQAGKLIASAPDEVVLELDNGIRLHFPKIGYIVRPQ